MCLSPMWSPSMSTHYFFVARPVTFVWYWMAVRSACRQGSGFILFYFILFFFFVTIFCTKKNCNLPVHDNSNIASGSIISRAQPNIIFFREPYLDRKVNQHFTAIDERP